MNKNGPIIVIEDDREFMKDVFIDLDYQNEIIFFEDGHLALHFLINEKVEPFIIDFRHQYASVERNGIEGRNPEK